MMTKSRIYKELSQQEIELIVQNLYGSKGKLLSAEILKGGLFNTTYLLHTDQEKAGLVLRVGPVNKHLLYDFEKDMMAVEPTFHKLLQENGIPTSNVLKFSSADTVIGRDYIITEYIPSIPMNDPSLNNADIGYIYEEVGGIVNRLHQIKGSRFGWLRPGQWGLYDTWYDFVSAFAKESAQKAEEYNLFTKAEIEKFRLIIAQSKNALDDVAAPRYVHFDLWQGNVLLTKDAQRYRVAAVIDLDRTIFGDLCWDLSMPWIVNDAFMKGYGSHIEKTASYKTREYVYRLLIGFLSAYVCLVQYDDFEWHKREKESVCVLLANETPYLL